jgi:hypothetical protein
MKLTIEHDPDSVIHQPLFIEWVIHPTRETDLYWNHYLQENPGRRKEIEEARFLIKNFGKDEDSLDQDEIEGIWNRISQQKLEKRPKTIRIRKWLAAASILLVLGLSGWTAHHYFSATKTLAVDYHAIAINKNNTGEVKLILSDQTEKTFTEKEVEIKYHENGEVETGEGKFQEGTNSPKEISESKMNQLIVPRGKRSNITLADGTKLWM